MAGCVNCGGMLGIFECDISTWIASVAVRLKFQCQRDEDVQVVFPVRPIAVVMSVAVLLK